MEELTAQSRRIAELIASIDEKTMRWLCELLNAPKVWIAEDSRFVEADVLTAEAVVASDELSRIDMVLREAQPETFQNR